LIDNLSRSRTMHSIRTHTTPLSGAFLTAPTKSGKRFLPKTPTATAGAAKPVSQLQQATARQQQI
jgi:hypothetical protein